MEVIGVLAKTLPRLAAAMGSQPVPKRLAFDHTDEQTLVPVRLIFQQCTYGFGVWLTFSCR
jgi:hypothetical protein